MNDLNTHPVHGDIEKNILWFEQLKKENLDLVIRRLTLANGQQAVLIYLDTLCDKTIINRDLLFPLLSFDPLEKQAMELLETISSSILAAGNLVKIQQLSEAMTKLLSGFTILWIDKCEQGLAIETISSLTRAITSPQMGSNYYSAGDAFVEVMMVNITLIRRKLRHEQLKVVSVEIGEDNKRMISVLYKENSGKKSLVSKIIQQLEMMKGDNVVTLDVVSHELEHRKYSLFPLCARLERPDAVANLLNDGKIAILCDEDPGCIIYPTTFHDLFKTSDDYANSSVHKHMVWLLRSFCFWIAVLLPALYIAIISFDPEILPNELMIAIAKSISLVPLPAVYEVYLVMFLVLIIKEASMNLPTKLGQTVSIVGGIILGQSLISANLVSAPVVIIITCATIAQLVIPNYKMISTVNLLSILLVFLGSSFGLFGVSIGLLILLIHLYGLNSMGEPYFSIKN